MEGYAVKSVDFEGVPETWEYNKINPSASRLGSKSIETRKRMEQVEQEERETQIEPSDKEEEVASISLHQKLLEMFDQKCEN